ncbi:MAG: ABC transporter permease [Devosiaceae bacterium]|nr:ABC transporter permease [Devosiaceae bacterium]
MKQFFAHAKLHLKRLLRNPAFWAPTILFPAMFYSFFGASMSPDGAYSQLAIGSFAVYAVVGIAFYQFGVGIAQDREDPFDSWMHTLPASALPNGLAQMFVAILFALSAVLLVLAASHVFGKTTLDINQTLRLLGICVVIALPASLLGIALGYSANAKAAPALANLIFLPLAFLGALWLPPIALPKIIADISVWPPTRQMAEFAWAAIGNTIPDTNFMLGLAAYTTGFAFLVMWLVNRDKKKRFG